MKHLNINIKLMSANPHPLGDTFSEVSCFSQLFLSHEDTQQGANVLHLITEVKQS